jgi:hypothetical protein
MANSDVSSFLDVYILCVHAALTIELLLASLIVWDGSDDVVKHLGEDSITRRMLTSAYFGFGFWSLTAFPFFFWERTWKLYIVSVTTLFELISSYCIAALISMEDAEESMWVAHGVTLGLALGGIFQIYYGSHVSFLWE